MKFSISFPSKTLSPNARVHWAKHAKAKTAYKHEAWAVCKSGEARSLRKAKAIHAHFVFVLPGKYRYDKDNLMARMKSAIDGMASAIGLDDYHWTTTHEVAEETVKGGRVDIELKEVK